MTHLAEQIAGQEQQERADRARVLELEKALREAYQISHYGRGSIQDIDDVLERAIRRCGGFQAAKTGDGR